MDRMTHPRAARRLAPALAALLALALAAACSNPVNLLVELEREVMRANDRFLVVEEIAVPTTDGYFSPTGTISITFDRDIDLASVTPDTLVIRKDDGTTIDYPDDGVTWVSSSKTLRVRVRPYLETNSDFVLSVSGVKGMDGSDIDEPYTASFSTGDVLAGAITSLVANEPTSSAGYTKTKVVDLVMTVNDLYGYVMYELSVDGGASFAFESAMIETPVGGELSFPDLDLETILGVSLDGPVELTVRFYGNSVNDKSTKKTGTDDTATIILDRVEPAAPSQPVLAAADDSGASASDGITKNTGALTFSGTAEPGSTVVMRADGIGAGSWIVGEGGSWTGDVSLPEGSYAMTAVALDAAGWESAASPAFALVVDTTAPSIVSLTPAAGNVAGLGLRPSASVTDAHGVEKVEFAIGGVSYGVDSVPVAGTYDAPTSWNTASLVEGAKYEVTAKAWDLAGNSVSLPHATYVDNVTIGDEFDLGELAGDRIGSMSALAFDPFERGVVHLVYRDDEANLLLYAFNADGGEGEWTEGKAQPQTGKGTNPAVAVDPVNHKLHVAFTDGSKLFYTSTGNLGVSWSTPIQVPGAVDPATRPSIAVDPTGAYVHVVYENDAGALAGSVLENGGTVFSKAITIFDKDPIAYPAVAINDGGVHVVWRAGSAGAVLRAVLDLKSGEVIDTEDVKAPEGAGYFLAFDARSYLDGKGNPVDDLLVVSGAGSTYSSLIATWLPPGETAWVDGEVDGKQPYVEPDVAVNAIEGLGVYHAAYYSYDTGYLKVAKSFEPSKTWYSYQIGRIPNKYGRGPSMASDGEWVHVSYYDEEYRTLRYQKVRINLFP